jgi:Zn ribbon nucleic-acid-binding protein
MVTCPSCKASIAKASKKWKYAQFEVELFECTTCGTRLREYSIKGKHIFALKFKKGKDKKFVRV